jgi:MipA family protein
MTQTRISKSTQQTPRNRKTQGAALAILTTCGLLGSMQSLAQAEPDVEGTNRPLWEAGVSAIGVSSPAYPGADERVSRALPLPWFIYRGPIFRADGDTVGARVVKTRTIEFDVGFAAALGASSEDVKVREGMPDLGFQFEFGPRMRVNLARPTADSIVRLDLPLRGVFEIEDGIKNRGVAFEPRISYADRNIGGGFGLNASAGVVIGDRKYNEFLYGVPSRFATPTRAAYRAKSGVITPRLQLALSHSLTDDLRVFAFTRYDFSGSGANTDSPLHVKNGGASYGLGVVWTLGRSSRKAAD